AAAGVGARTRVSRARDQRREIWRPVQGQGPRRRDLGSGEQAAGHYLARARRPEDRQAVAKRFWNRIDRTRVEIYVRRESQVRLRPKGNRSDDHATVRAEVTSFLGGWHETRGAEHPRRRGRGPARHGS